AAVADDARLAAARRNEAFEARLALLERKLGEVLAVDGEQVECEVGEGGGVARVLQGLEAGDAAGEEGSDLAVEDDALDGEARDGLGDRWKLGGPVLEAAAEEAHVGPARARADAVDA